MYCTIADLKLLMSEEQLLQLADDGVDSPTPEQVMNEAIDQADREIDGYLNAIRPVPLDPVPLIVPNISAKIAAYNLFRRKPHLEAGEWATEYDRQVKLLEKIASGKIGLGLTGDEDPGEQAQPTEPGKMVAKSRPPHFPDRIWEEY